MTLTAAYGQLVTADQVRDPQINNCPCINSDTPTDDELELMIDEASDIIAIASGFVVAGRRNLVARPCRTECDWSCPCCGRDAIPLGDRNPTVTQVKINGVALANPGSYMLHQTLIGPALVRIDTPGTGMSPRSWPSVQDWWLDDTQDRTFAIYFTDGMDTDRLLVRDAMFEIICDMVLNPSRRRQTIPGATAATMGNVSVQLDEDRLARVRSGAFGPATARLMSILAPAGQMTSTVWAPEMTGGWDLNLQVAA